MLKIVMSKVGAAVRIEVMGALQNKTLGYNRLVFVWKNQ